MAMPDPTPCPHVAIVAAEMKGKFSDDQVRAYICMRCGFPMLAAPVVKFKHNPEAKAFFDKIAKEFRLSLPKM